MDASAGDASVVVCAGCLFSSTIFQCGKGICIIVSSIQKSYNYCEMTTLAANISELLDVSNPIRLRRSSVFSLKLVIFSNVIDFWIGLILKEI